MNEQPVMAVGRRLHSFLHRLEDACLVLLLLLMILLATSQILLRNLLGSGIFWGDVLTRILVLWVGLAGAMTASREDNHIRIDIVTRYLPEIPRNAVTALTALFTSAICALVAFHSVRFLRMEYAYGAVAFAQVPVWICQTIIPLAFSIMALRYILLGWRAARKIFENRP